ncbi:hypothetical protein [Candidatus Darwinibacter acetoxidans]
MKQLNIQIEDDQHEWLRQKAFRERVSMAQVVREIINKSMKEERLMKKATFRVPEMERTDLLEVDPSSQSLRPQTPYLELDLTSPDNAIHIDTYCQIDGTPISVWHGVVRRYYLSPKTNAEALTTDINAGVFDDLFQRIVDGSEVEWNGSNYVARLNEDAREAEEELEKLLEDYVDESIGLWDAGEWLQDSSDEDLGVTAASTDDELAKKARELEEEARAEGAIVVWLEDELKERRQALRESMTT